jgi:hypothetical protein
VLQAEAQKLLYDAAKQAAQGTPTPADDLVVAATFCVKKSPEPRHFEVCVGRIEGELESLSLGSVDDVTLAYSTAPGHLFAESIEVSDLRAVIPGRLADVFIRWTEGLPTCLIRPQGNLDGADLDIPEIDAWTRCLDLEATVDAHTDGPIDLTFEPDPQNVELLDVQRVLAADFQSSHERTVSRVGTCADAFVNDQVELLIERFFSRMEDALSDAWDAAPMHEADALELLLARFEHGTFEPADHELRSRLETLSSFEDLDGDGHADIHGMFGEFDTDAELRPEFEAGSKLPFWVYPPNHDFPYSEDGRDEYGQPFDVMFATSTGALNQVIRERTITDRLYKTLEPTCDQLGLIGQPYCPTGDTVPVLDGTVLGDRYSGFAALGATQVAIVMYPTMMPFTRIHPDPPPTNPGDPLPLPGRAPLLYHLGQYVVELVETQPNPGIVWLRMYVDFFDEGLQLSLNPVPGSRVLTASLGVPLTSLTIVETGFGATCPMVSVRNVPGLAAACSRQMAADMADLLTPVLEHSLVDMLREHPAPMYFDAEGLATNPAHVQQTDRYQGNQNIVFYADIP